MKTKSVRIREKLYGRLREVASAEGLAISEVVDDILVGWIDSNYTRIMGETATPGNEGGEDRSTGSDERGEGGENRHTNSAHGSR